MKRFKTIVLLCFMVLVQFLFACSKIHAVDLFDDYNDFLKNLTQYDLPDIEEALPEIPNYKPIIAKGFDYAQNFSGPYAFVKIEGKNLIMDTLGKLYAINDDLSYGTLVNDVCLYQIRNLYGLKLFNGEVFLPAKYQEITYIGNTILASDLNYAEIYVNKKFIAKVNYKINLHLIDEFVLLYEGNYCDLNLNPLKYLDYKIIDTPYDGMILIEKNNFYGYVSADYQTIIEPIYHEAYRFNNGYAAVVKDNTNILLNKQGNVVFQSDKIRIDSFANGYFCFIMNNFSGIMNTAFQIISTPVFTQIQDNRVYNKFVLDKSNEHTKIYDLKSAKYLETKFKKVEALNTTENILFLCTNLNDTKSLYNENFECIADAYDSISIYKSIILLEKDKKFYFYMRSES